MLGSDSGLAASKGLEQSRRQSHVLLLFCSSMLQLGRSITFFTSFHISNFAFEGADVAASRSGAARAVVFDGKTEEPKAEDSKSLQN